MADSAYLHRAIEQLESAENNLEKAGSWSLARVIRAITTLARNEVEEMEQPDVH